MKPFFLLGCLLAASGCVTSGLRVQVHVMEAMPAKLMD